MHAELNLKLVYVSAAAHLLSFARLQFLVPVRARAIVDVMQECDLPADTVFDGP